MLLVANKIDLRESTTPKVIDGVENGDVVSNSGESLAEVSLKSTIKYYVLSRFLIYEIMIFLIKTQNL